MRIGLALLVGAGLFAAGWSSRMHYLPMPFFCDGLPCAKLADRLTDIANDIAQAGSRPRYLAIGDSLTEGVKLPSLCGRVAINAGIAGATSEVFERRARGLAAAARPDFVTVGLGTNDALLREKDAFRTRMAAIMAALADYTVVVIPVPDAPNISAHAEFNEIIAGFPALVAAKAVPAGHTAADGVHFDPTGTELWKESLADAAGRVINGGSPCTEK